MFAQRTRGAIATHHRSATVDPSPTALAIAPCRVHWKEKQEFNSRIAFFSNVSRPAPAEHQHRHLTTVRERHQVGSGTDVRPRE